MLMNVIESLFIETARCDSMESRARTVKLHCTRDIPIAMKSKTWKTKRENFEETIVLEVISFMENRELLQCLLE